MFAVQNENIKGFIYAAASSILVGLGFVLVKITLKNINSESSSVYFIGFGLLTSFLFLGMRGELKKLNLFKTYWKPLTIFGFMGGAGVLAWFYAIDLIGPSLTAFLLRFLIVFTVLWGILFFKEKFNIIEVLGMVIAGVGVIVLTYTSNNGQLLLSGVVVALASAFLFSLMQLIVKIYAGRIPSLIVNHFRLLLTFPIILAYALVMQKLQTPNSLVLILSFIAGFVSGVIGVSLFYKALELTDLSKVNIIRTMDPFVVIVFALLFLQEIPSLSQLTGGLIIVIGIVILILARHRPKILARWGP